MYADERETLVKQLLDAPKRVSRALAAAEGKPRPAGEWSLNAIVGHLLRVEQEVWQARFYEMVEKDNPHWEYWEPDGIDWEAEYGGWELPRLMEGFAERRWKTAEYLRRLPEEGWQRIGTHRTFGVLDVAGLCREMLKHDEVHIQQIAKTG